MKDPQQPADTNPTNTEPTEQPATDYTEAELLAAEQFAQAAPPAESLGDILQRMLQQALEAHERNGNPVAKWQDGKIVILPENAEHHEEHKD